MTTRRLNIRQWLRDNWLELFLLILFLIALVWLAMLGRGAWQMLQPEPVPTRAPIDPQALDGQRALETVTFLTGLGPRVAGSAAHQSAAEHIQQELQASGWEVTAREFEQDGIPRLSIIASAGDGPAVAVATHYDSSPAASQDPDEANRVQPSPGANDGASGAAVLLELARTLDQEQLDAQVWLAFLDGQYDATGAVIAGGAQDLLDQPPWTDAPVAILWLDLLGAAGQRFYPDSSADPLLSQQLWDIAGQLGLGDWFVAEPRQAPDLGQAVLAQLGAPLAVIAGGDYPHWRTLQDTIEQIDPNSLERVALVVRTFLESQ